MHDGNLPSQFWFDRLSTDGKLSAIYAAIRSETMTLQTDLQTLSDQADATIAAVNAETDVATGMELLLQSNTQMLKDILAVGGLPQAVTDKLKAAITVSESKRQEFLDAVTANTVAAQTP